MSDYPYAAHETLVAPARRRPELWRLLAGLALIAVVTIGLGIVFRGTLATVFRLRPDLAIDLARSNTPGALLLMLYSYAFVIVAVVVAARMIHDRGLVSLIGPTDLALRQFGKVIGLLLLVNLAMFLLPPYGGEGELVRNLDTRTWLALLPLSLGAILVQTASEELLFRGYLQQALAARFRSPLIWMLVPALLFGIGHYQPTAAGDNAWVIVLWTLCFGVISADLTARAGTLGPAIALHMVNNATALLLVSLPGPQSGLSLATLPYGMDDQQNLSLYLVLDFAFLLIGWLAARIAIRR